MKAIGHVMGADLTLGIGLAGESGLVVVEGVQAVRERLLRRLCTSAGASLWQSDYGAGLPQMVGTPVNAATIRSVIEAQMALESGVDQTRPVGVSVSSGNEGVVQVLVSYVDAQTQTTQALLVSA